MASHEHRAATKPPGRSRWNANPQQLQTLESIFEQGSGTTPNKPRIKDIAVQLSQYGPISDTNVYNWFQNRKARAKRKLQHQVGRRRIKLARSTADHALQLNPQDEEAKPGADAHVTSPRAKHFKGDGDLLVQNKAMSCLEPHSHLGAGSSSARGIEGVLAEDLRSHVDFATLATVPQLPSVDPATDMLFSDHGFHEQGTVDPSSPLQQISVEVKEWDARHSCRESSNIVDSQTPYLPPRDVDNFNFLSGLAGDKYLISLAGDSGPVPSTEGFRKGAAVTRGLKTEEAIAAAASETCV